jgi:hypothetical protein
MTAFRRNEPKNGEMTNAERTPGSEASTPSTVQNNTPEVKSQKKPPLWRRAYNILTWTPPNCRWDPAKPPQFSMSMNVLFAFAAGFTVANLYYNHPILNILAQDFGVRYEQVAQIPTVMQAGYAAGLLFLCPLGDLLPRRPFVCGLVLFTATMWYVYTLPIILLRRSSYFLKCWASNCSCAGNTRRR